MKPPESAFTVWDGPYQGESAPRRGLPFGSSSVQHGTAVFEGIRCYSSPDGPMLFRLEEHLARLLNSAQLLGINHDYNLDRLRQTVLAAASRSAQADCYVRPGLFAADPYLSIDLSRLPFTLGVEVWPMPSSADRTPPVHSGVRLTVSPWRRPLPASFPPRAKAVGTYVTSALAKTAAVKAGFDDAIQLDPESGRVAEATVSNIFIVRNATLLTPWLSESLLAGITRDTVLTLARQLGILANEGPVEVGDLTTADEVFCTGTASELVPAASVDDYRLPAKRPVFDALSEAFRSAVTGREFSHLGWLTPASAASPALK